MVIVLDTNVIISALLSSEGRPAEIIRRWEESALEVVISPALLVELRRALNYPRVRKHLQAPQKTVTSLIKRLATVATVVEPQLSPDVVKEDPADNQVLECAVAGRASYIITGDAHLLRLKEHQGAVVLDPAGFLVLASLRS